MTILGHAIGRSASWPRGRLDQLRPRRRLVPPGFVTGSIILTGAVLGTLLGLVGNVLVVGALVAAGALAIVIIRPQLATYAFLFVLYLNLPAIAVQYYNVPTPLAGTAILILIAPVLDRVVIRREPLVVPVPAWLMLAYFGAMLLSALMSGDIATSLVPINVFLTEGLPLYLLVVNVLRTTSEIRAAIWVLVITGALMGAISVWQEATHSYHNTLGGFAQISLVGFNVGGATLDIRPRLAGPVGETNRYAQVMLYLFPLALFRFWGARHAAARVVAGVATILILAGVLLTFSRGAAVALAGLLVVMTVLRYVRPQRLLLLGAAVGLAIGLIAPQFIIRLNSLAGVAGLFDDSGNNPDGAILGRFTSNLAALSVFLEHPVIGVGPDQYFRNYSQDAGNQLGLKHFDRNRQAHSMYLEVLADTGIVGFSAFAGVIGATLVGLWRARRRWKVERPDLADLAASFWLSVVAYLFTAVFLHLSYERYFWVLLALAAAATLAIAREAAVTSAETTTDKAQVSAGKGATQPLVSATG